MGLVDGPGIRVVLFLQGCDLRCLYCHNPETWGKGSKTQLTVDETISKILKYKTYIQKNGGVTFSGGEPLLQSEYIYQCLLKLKEHNIHTCIDTAGVANNYDKLIDLVDLFIVDVKAIDPSEYQHITGKDMNLFNDFMQKLIIKKKKIWLRQVVIPTINDDKEHMIQLANYAKNIPTVEKIEILPYHTYGEVKYQSLNMKYRLKDVPALSKEKEEYLNNILKEHYY